MWVPYHCSKLGTQAGMKLLAATAAVLLVFPACLAGFGFFGLAVVLAMMFVGCVVMSGLLLGTLLPDKLFLWLQRSIVTGRQPALNRQPQSASISDTQLHRQMDSSRQPQAQATPTLHSPAPAMHQSFSVPARVDQPRISALISSFCEFFQEQTAIMAAYPWQWESSTPPGTRGADSSAAGPSTSAAASAVPSSMPIADRSSTSRSKAATENESQLGDVCVVCMDASKDWLCLPCHHLAMCGACTARIQHQTQRCPICQQYIRQAVQVYKA